MQDVFNASHTSIKEVMRPRGDVTFLDGAMPLPEAAATVRTLPYSRYPVTEGGFDDVVGFLHVRDLLDLRPDDPRRVRDVRRPVLMLPATNRVLPAVSTMRHEGTHLAVVVDEYGGTDGIVTLEDLVEELVGEIRDEYDAVEPAHRARDEPVSVDGATRLEDFTQRSGIVLTDGAYETVAGYVIARLGRIPEVGDTVSTDGPDAPVLEVAEMAGQRVIRLTVLPPTAGPVQPDGSS